MGKCRSEKIIISNQVRYEVVKATSVVEGDQLCIVLRNALFAPDIMDNVISVSEVMSRNYCVIFDDDNSDSCQMLLTEFKNRRLRLD